MKKSLVTAMAALAVCAMALAAAAQQERNVTTAKDKGDTIKVNVSGRVVLDYVWRSKELTTFTESYSTFDVPNADAENTFEGYAAVRVDAELSDKVSAVIEIGTLRVQAGGLGGGPDSIREFGSGFSEANAICLREAQIRLSEILMPELSVKAGIADWSFDVRGKGQCLAFDPRRSQTIARNIGFGSGTQQTDTYEALHRADNMSEQYPVGGVVTYARDAMTLHLVLLPTVIEAGAPCQDEALYALDFWYNIDQLGKGSKVGLVAAIHGLSELGPALDAGTNHTRMFTVGGGVLVKPEAVAGLELYGEIYKQFGKVGESVDTGTEEQDLDAKGLAFQIGAEYHFNDPMGIWLGINYTYVSGDGDDTENGDVDRFLAYESINDLLIVEDMYFGLDVDCNYTAIKISGGVALSVGQGKNNLEICAIVGLCKAQEKLAPYGGTDDEDKLGTEFDIRVKYNLSKQASLSGAFAILTGSDVMEDAMGGSGVDDAEDKCMLYTLGLDVKF